MTDTQLVDWLCRHPLVSSYWDRETYELILSTFSAIGRGRDFRAALVDLIENSESRATGIPNARDRKVAAGLPVPDDDSYVEVERPGLKEVAR